MFGNDLSVHGWNQLVIIEESMVGSELVVIKKALVLSVS